MECDSRRLGVQADRARKLNSRLRIGWPGQFDFTTVPFRDFSKRKGAIIQDVGISGPMLLIIISFGQEPEFVAAIVEPLAGTRWKVLPGQLGIHEQVRMSGKSDLH